jgi:hypothetical protein
MLQKKGVGPLVVLGSADVDGFAISSGFVAPVRLVQQARNRSAAASTKVVGRLWKRNLGCLWFCSLRVVVRLGGLSLVRFVV